MTRRQQRPGVFCVAPSPSTDATASPSSASCPTTAPATAPPSTRSPAARWGCATCAPAPTGRAPTEKAERFIRTFLAGWAYGAIYATSTERTAALDGGLWTYNHRRPHGAPSHQPPIARLNELNNLAGSYSYASTSAASPREWLLPSWTGEAWRARRRRSFQVIPSRSSAGMPIATAVAISTAWRMMP
jgi:hypothetical protein